MLWRKSAESFKLLGDFSGHSNRKSGCPKYKSHSHGSEKGIEIIAALTPKINHKNLRIRIFIYGGGSAIGEQEKEETK